MRNILLRPAEVERDFGQLAAWFTLEQDEPTTEPGLKADYEAHKERILRLMVAEGEGGELLGFNWATRSRLDEREAYFYVIVRAERRGQGVGGRLYDDVEQAARAGQIETLQVSVRDNCPECRAFAARRGFEERAHTIGMELDLRRFDDRPYDEMIARLRGEGFEYTTMEALGNTEEAQRKLYRLNDTAAAETPGSEGAHSWLSFEDFRERVCGAEWYRPAGQMVVIDRASGEWAAMSAITRFEGADCAYNLFTGVERRYRGRKLAQTVKVLALRYARDVLKVDTVQTHHNAVNAAMIAIDRKLGYERKAGYYTMKKALG
jgi:RimJ/RimL family protein N-acetyltransferase